MKEIRDYIPEDKKEFCNNCMDCTCSRSCPIWRDAMIAQDQDTKEKYHLKDVSSDILGYFRYYASKYEILTRTKGDLIEIPIKDGSHSLDNYFINILTRNGWEFKESPLLGMIYMIRTA